jgi:hypothetical protein
MLEILTAKQMRKYFKEKKKQEKEKIRIENQQIKEEVIAYWLNRVKESGRTYYLRYTLYIEDEEENPMETEIYKNFQAYQKAFKKLGYRLAYANDAQGCGWGIYV